MDNVLTKLILRVLVAGYIIYMAVKLITARGTSGNQVVFMVIAVLFIVASAGFIVYAIKDYFKKRQLNENNSEENDFKESDN